MGMDFDWQKEHERHTHWYVNKVCPDLRERMPELVKEYGTEKPYFSTADVLERYIEVVSREPGGIVFHLGEERRRVAEILGKRIETGMEEVLTKEFGVKRRETVRRKPVPEMEILYNVCQLLPQIKRGRTGSMAQQKRIRMMRMHLWLWEHPEDRLKRFIIA